MLRLKPLEMPKRNKIFAVIDTNVVVSSLFSKDGTSSPAQVVTAVLQGEITPLYNDEILSEYREVLQRPKFSFTQSQIDEVLSIFVDYGVKSFRVDSSEEDMPDLDDIVFYEVTLSVVDAYLVTGNVKHFPHKSFVVTPTEMVNILNGSKRANY